MKSKTYLILFLFCSLEIFSQDLQYARSVLDTLCSPEMAGRGYVNKGETKAADFIASEFKKIGVDKLSENYKQSFYVPVNAIDGVLELKIGKKILRPGYDYLIDPRTKTFSGTYQILYCNEKDILNKKKVKKIIEKAHHKFIAISPLKKTLSKKQKEAIDYFKFLLEENNSIKGIINITNNKLTWRGATSESNKPILTIKKGSFKKRNSITLNVKSTFTENYKTQNVIGFIKGTSQPDSLIVITAHYDHLGKMGAQTYFPGANDNASGIAILLNMAKHFTENEKPKHSMLFIAFGAEEIGLLGSKFYVENPLLPLEKIKFLVNFDISGTGNEGIQVVNGSKFKKNFDKLVNINSNKQYLKQVKIRGESCNSDHCMFYQKGVPSFFIYTLGGIKAYHDVYDRAETLPFTEYENYFKLMLDFLNEI